MSRLKKVVTLSVCVLVLMISLFLCSTRVSAEPVNAASVSSSTYTEGSTIKTRGTVKYQMSIYMFEDFWLQSEDFGNIPAVVRFAGLPIPPEGSQIEVSGTIEYCELEGGFYYLNIQSYSYSSVDTASEYPSLAVLLLLMALSITAVIFYKRKRTRCSIT